MHIAQLDGVEGATGPARHRQRSQAVASANPRSSGKRRTSWTLNVTRQYCFLRLRFDEVTVMSWCYTLFTGHRVVQCSCEYTVIRFMASHNRSRGYQRIYTCIFKRYRFRSRHLTMSASNDQNPTQSGPCAIHKRAQ